MTGVVREARRVGWLDGLRGIAALQVVLLHYMCAFLPGVGLHNPRLVHYRWETAVIGTPLTLPFAGDAAVFLFFIMSGVALTYAFAASQLTVTTKIIRRIIRLGVPMIASVLLAAVLFKLLPRAAAAAAMPSGAGWLASIGPQDVSPAAILHQIGLEGLLAGFRDWSMLPAWCDTWLGLVPGNTAFNTPLWTLHLEFAGSLLVLGLTCLRAAVRPGMHRAACIVLLVCFFASPLGLFIAGHLAAPWLGRFGGGRWRTNFGAGSLLLGVYLCTAPAFNYPPVLLAVLREPPIGPAVGIDHLQLIASAMLMFAGFAMLPILRKALERPAMRWLGKISFSLYLTHFPILLTIVCAVFPALVASVPYGAAVAIALAGGMAISIPVAVLFERWIDRPAISCSRAVSCRSPSGWIYRLKPV